MKILFVCMSNICRSPALEAALRHLAAQKGWQVEIDSCGMGWLHVGEPPDPRMFEAAKQRGIVIDHRAQQFRDEFFDEFDLILAVDRDIAEQLKYRAETPEQIAKVHLASEFSRRYSGKDIPDPYYLNGGGFDHVMDMVLDICEGLANKFSSRQSGH